MSTNNYSELRTLISAFCRNEIKHNRCTEDCCEFCCMNEAYDKTKASEALDAEDKKE